MGMLLTLMLVILILGALAGHKEDITFKEAAIELERELAEDLKLLPSQTYHFISDNEVDKPLQLGTPQLVLQEAKIVGENIEIITDDESQKE